MHHVLSLYVFASERRFHQGYENTLLLIEKENVNKSWFCLYALYYISSRLQGAAPISVSRFHLLTPEQGWPWII